MTWNKWKSEKNDTEHWMMMIAGALNFLYMRDNSIWCNEEEATTKYISNKMKKHRLLCTHFLISYDGQQSVFFSLFVVSLFLFLSCIWATFYSASTDLKRWYDLLNGNKSFRLWNAHWQKKMKKENEEAPIMRSLSVFNV